MQGKTLHVSREDAIAFFGLEGHGIVFSRADKAFLRPFLSFFFSFSKGKKKNKK